ncbi:MAG: PocR ligand-binding domain-containing protein, partial [Bacteroidales bacterium]|nr:PocR ligand-binding domain-containing protein [Bacteroidales bacterium]
FEQSLDGCFIIMLDEPVIWNGQVNKDELFEYVYHNQKVTRMNKAMTDQYLAKADEMIGWRMADFFKHDEEQGRKVWRKLLDQGLLHVDTEERRLDGSRFYVEGEYRCMYDNKGRIIGSFGLQRDVTERKKSQQLINKRMIALTRPIDDPQGIDINDLFDLEDLQRIQDEFADAVGVASMITYRDGTPLTKPTNFCRLCKDIIRQTDKGRQNCAHSDAIIGKTTDAGGPVIQPCLSGGLWDAGASIIVDGKHIASWLIGQVRNEAQDNEKILDYADEIGYDREEFKKALAEVPVMSEQQFTKLSKALYTIANELSLRAYYNMQQARFIVEKQEVEAALRLSEEKYRTLVQYSSDPIYSINPNETYRYVNESFAKSFGKNPENIIGRTPYDIFSEEEAENGLRLVRKVFQTGERGSSDVKIETSPGEYRYFLTLVDPILDESGQVNWVSCISKDITDRKQAEEELLQAKEKAEESDRLKSAFLANMSHEIRTPMNSIVGFAELLAEEEVNVESRMKFAKLIESGSEQLLSLVNDIIDISKIEAGQLNLSPTKFEINSLIQEVYLMFSALRLRMGKDQVHLNTDLSGIDENTEVFTDRNRLRQVLINLGQNALKFTESGTITFGCQKQNDKTLRLFVKDTGIGISPMKQELIFIRFRQLDDTCGRATRGTGLGLAISKNLVTLMGGEIGVESEPGTGSDFWFTLPMKMNPN